MESRKVLMAKNETGQYGYRMNARPMGSQELRCPGECIKRRTKMTWSYKFFSRHVKELFEHVISQIRALVNDQVKKIHAKEKVWPKVRDTRYLIDESDAILRPS